jgi:HK97 family phage prohead protease
MNPSFWLPALLTRSDMEDEEKPDGTMPAKLGPSLFVASSSAVDRAEDIVEQDWDLAHFRANPVILWAHRYDLPPVGKAVAIEVREGKLLASVEWDEDGAGKEVARQVKSGFLSAVSVGFYPGQSVPRRSLPEGDPRRADYGYIHSKCKLLEISVVPVPANPEALAIARGAPMFDAGMVRACLAKGLPLPGRDGELVDVLRRTLPRDLVRVILSDEALTQELAAALAKAAPKPPEPKDPFAELFGPSVAKAAKQDGQSLDEWFGTEQPASKGWDEWFRAKP